MLGEQVILQPPELVPGSDHGHLSLEVRMRGRPDGVDGGHDDTDHGVFDPGDQEGNLSDLDFDRRFLAASWERRVRHPQVYSPDLVHEPPIRALGGPVGVGHDGLEQFIEELTMDNVLVPAVQLLHRISGPARHIG